MVLAAAGASFAGVFALRQTSANAADSIALLYVIPVALVALELGLIAGVGAALAALALVGVWSLTEHVTLGVVGFATRAVAYVAIGAVAGRFGERMRDAQRRQRQLLDSGLELVHLRSAETFTASLAHHARLLLRIDGVSVALGEALARGDTPARAHTTHVPIGVHGTRYGTLVLDPPRRLSDEDRATAATLALQAAVTLEGQALLASERDRADQLRELMVHQEAERGRVSRELNEDAAQTLAGVLLGLAALQRKLGAASASASASTEIEDLRADIDSTLQLLRSLAVSLRPTILPLGLLAALHELADGARARGFNRVDIALDATDELSPEMQTTVYRGVQEALDAAGPAELVSVRSGEGGRILIDVGGARSGISPERLKILRARIELAGGIVRAAAHELHAAIPVAAERTRGGPAPRP